MSILKENTFKKSHKILFTLLTIIGMTGLVSGMTVFLVLGSDSKYEADTTIQQPSPVEIKSVTYKHTKSSQNENEKSVPSKKETDLVTNSTPEVNPKSDVVSETNEVDYIVKDGDSLSQISERFKTSVVSIMQQTKLTSQEQIYSGQHLKFLRSYIAKEENTTSKEDVTKNPSESDASSDVVIVDNGNKVVSGGLSKEDRTYVLSQLQSRTGVSASQWDYIISRESGWLSTIKNSLGYYGLFQLAPNYPGYDGDIDAQINSAIYLFNNGGMNHWAL